MLEIHQPYKSKYVFAFVSIGVLLLGGFVVVNSVSEKSIAYAAGDSRTIHDIENMQEMTQQICSNTDIGDTVTLDDNRDTNSYTIVKLEDGNCWMQENLRLGGGVGLSLDSSNTNIAGDWTLPAATTSWINNYGLAQTRIGSTNLNSEWKTSWGNYYSWCAATAGTCSETTADNKNVSGSICPKGWHLPSGGSTSATSGGVGTDSEFYKLTNGMNMSTITGSPYLFSSAGRMRQSDGDGVLSNAGSSGYYWSSTSGGQYYDSYAAYSLDFDGSSFHPGTYGDGRYSGFSVRCVASGGLEKIEKPVWQDTADAGINVTVPKVITLDVSDGVNATADAYNVVTGEIVATVTSNNIDYEVLLSSEQPSLIGQKDSTNSIPVVSSTNPVEKSNNAWGILNASNLYDPITKTPQQFYNTAVANGNTISHTYTVGISISPTLPADTYSTTVTVTASSK